MKKRNTLLIIMLMCSVLLCACNNNGESMENECADKNGENEQEEYAESTDREADTDSQIEKGYDLPIDARQREEEFEHLIMEYLLVTAEEIQSYAVFDEEKQTYAWVRGTDIRGNDDGTFTLTVDAVCSMILCDDAVITHELTVQFSEDGSFQYLGNKILNDGISNIPEYQYRIIRE